MSSPSSLVAVISMDMTDATEGRGQLRSIDGRSFIDQDTPEPDQVFAALADLGTSGSPGGMGRAAAYTMVESDSPANEGFLREAATLQLVFISDDDDQSGRAPITTSAFLTWMQHAKATELALEAAGLTREFFLSRLPASPLNLEVAVVTERQGQRVQLAFTACVVGEELDQNDCDVVYLPGRNSVLFLDYVPELTDEIVVHYEVRTLHEP